MFRKVLIANRGEIAVRVLRACHELGVDTVTVFSDVDRAALHVRYADEAYHIGPPPARDSYLQIDTLIDVARRSGAQAIHPGYGFLAENPDFAAACEQAGITFIGPSADAIAAMGDKVQARRLMEAAGVPVIPGTDVELSNAEILATADEVGFPLFIKAAAGGGGKGMRVVDDPADMPRSLEAARREAAGAFGDDRIYLEKAISNARHVEIQVLADSQGNTIHLGERECSIQRRHQKLIEEAPSPVLDRTLRERMGEVAVRAAQAVNYANAGTVEFLLDEDRNFYFLEMNTRIQVEHPVTELVTGIDMVREQLRLAAGRRLRYSQADIVLKGHAIECRITAEDPYNNFLPSSGRIISIYEPSGPGVRLDAGVYEGFEVSLYYDPLIAKLIVWGDTRGEALLRMRRALSEYRILGIETSIPFHQQVMDVTNFIGGSYDTSFIDKHFSMIPEDFGQDSQVAAIVATLLTHQQRQQALATSATQSSGGTTSPWKLAGRPGAPR
jgi:acetyl-CoA carboxylase biotin carboxylase subunit